MHSYVGHRRGHQVITNIKKMYRFGIEIEMENLTKKCGRGNFVLLIIGNLCAKTRDIAI